MAETRTAVRGYMVLIKPGSPAWESTAKGSKGVLYRAGHRSPATLYPSRDAARRRIGATLAFAEAHGLDWPARDYSIVAVRGTLPPSCLEAPDAR